MQKQCAKNIVWHNTESDWKFPNIGYLFRVQALTVIIIMLLYRHWRRVYLQVDAETSASTCKYTRRQNPRPPQQQELLVIVKVFAVAV
jgi:hypothetical protein